MNKTVVFERKEIETILELNGNSVEDVEEFKYLGRLGTIWEGLAQKS